jgi:LuxR family maltose regulon positive regulatory protein
MVLKSKLAQPIVSPSYVDRPRLYRELDRWRSLRALCIHAPTGYGKSSLVGRWLARVGATFPAAWLNLDNEDSDPRSFLLVLAVAIDRFAPGAVAMVRPILDDVAVEPQRVLRVLLLHLQDALTRDALQAERDVLLVIDDVHLAQSADVVALIRTILERGPPGLHLFLLSRRPIGPPLARFHAYGQVGSLGPEDLRFNLEEVRLYLAQNGLAPGTETDLAEIMVRSEGWIAVLQLATMAHPHPAATHDLLAGLHGSNRWLADYLVIEVLAHQSAAVRRFLLQTAILDRFNASLCTAVCDDPNAAGLLTEIAVSNSFLIALDDHHEWYRYHHLFQELLQRELHNTAGATHIAILHRRAAHWLADAGAIRDAVRHLQAAGDDDAMVSLLADRLPAIVMRDPFRARQLFELVPQRLLVQQPRLLLERCRLEVLFASRELHSVVQQVEQALAHAVLSPAEASMLRATLLVYQAAAYHADGDLAAVEATAEAARTRAAELDNFASGMLDFLLMHLRRYAGRHIEADQHAARAISAFEQEGFAAGVVAVRRELARFAFRHGQSSEANRLFATIIGDRRSNQPVVLHEVLYTCLYAAENSYWQNDLAEARVYLVQALTLARRLQHEQPIATATALEMLVDTAETWPDTPVRLRNDVLAALDYANWRFDLQVRLLLRAGRNEEVWHLVEKLGVDPKSDPARLGSSVILPFLRAAIANNVELHALAPFLERALAHRRATGDRFVYLQLLALNAWHTLRIGNQAAARETLAAAAGLALGTGYVRVILDIPELLPLLDAPPTPARTLLTSQEQAVLRLLAVDYRYEQIARELTISINTVRTHVRHIYKKLGTNRRIAALERARALGIYAGEG